MKPIKTTLFISALIVTLVVAVSCTTTKTISKAPSISVSETMREKKTERFEYNVHIPFFKDYPDVSKRLESIVKTRFKDFDRISALNYKARIETMPKKEREQYLQDGKTFSEMKNKDESDYTPPHAFFVSWKAGDMNKKCISIRLETYVYVGGANGMSYIDTLTVNPTTGKDIPLASFFPREKNLYEMLSQKTARALKQKYDIDGSMQEMIKNGTEAKSKNFESFTTQNGLVTIHFSKYQVVAGAYGTPSVTIK